jgi:phage terminase large subunit
MQKPQLSKAALEDWAELRRIWRKDPVSYTQHRLGLNPTTQQRQLLEAIAPEGAKVTARAGHGVGKSSAVGAAIWWLLECFDYPKIPCTAPSASQLRDVLWSELSKWSRKSDDASRLGGLPPELWISTLFKVTQDRIYDIGSPDEWFAVARTARKENPDALQGFHASALTISDDGASVLEAGDGGQIMFVVEEASGVDDKIFEVAEGALSSHGARLLMVGNPTRNTGYFARSHKQDRADYTALHFKCSDSPLVDGNYRERLVRKFGEGSNVVRVRADGEFPKQDDDVLIALEDVEGALDREPGDPSGERRLGVDVARFGDDRTVFVLRQGSRIEHVVIKAKQDTMVTAGQAKNYRALWKADRIYVDANGLGAGVVDRLKEQNEPVVGVMVSEAAPERARRLRPGGAKQDGQPFKLRDFLWMEMARWVREESPSFKGVDKDTAEDLAGELASVKYHIDSSGRIVVESKDEMKRRGLRSPDLADALGVTFAESRTMVISDEVLARSRMPRRSRW